MTFTPFEVFSSLAVIALLVLNLRVSSAVGGLKAAFQLDLKCVELELSKLKTEMAKEQGNLLMTVMKTMNDNFVARGQSEAMHEANTQRLDAIDARLVGIDNRLSDIG